MPHFNQCTFVGHVGRDAELKQSKDGSKQWAEFNLAVSTAFFPEKKTAWVKCSVWGKSLEKVQQYVKKGDAVLVTGRLSDVSLYQTKDGESRINLQLSVSDWQSLKGKGEENILDSVPNYNSTIPHGAGDGLDNIPF